MGIKVWELEGVVVKAPVADNIKIVSYRQLEGRFISVTEATSNRHSGTE